MPRSATLASCAAAAVLASSQAAAGGSVSLRGPDRLVLGPNARAAIEVEVEGHGDAPPTLTVNVGRIERLRPAGAGRFVADYVPPAEQYPQVAIVAARAGGAWAWTALPLYGRGLALARSAPHARIRVTIGDVPFGPVTADATGEARVPVVAPPGARFAYHRDKPLDLEVPPVLHVHLALGRAAAPADAALDVPLRAFAVSPHGAPRAGAPLRVEVSEGRVVELAETGPGSWAGTWRLEPGRAGVASATATLADEPGLAAVAQLPRAPGPLARLAVQPDARRVTAGDAVLLRIAATDAVGNPVEVAPAVEATHGALSSLARVAPGTWEASLAVPKQLGALRRAGLVARAGAVEGRAELELAAGPAVAMEVAAEAPGLVADGGAAARVRVRLRDRFGNPAEAAAPEVTATRRGELAAEPDGPGAWVIRYRPRRAREDRTETVSVRAGGLAGEAQLAIVAPERRLGLAPKLGIAASSAGLLAPYGALEATYRSRWLDGRLALGLELGRFVHERTDAARVGDVALPIHGRARYLPALLTARWQARVRGRQSLWASAGGGLAHVGSEVSADGVPASLEQGLVPVVHAGAGWAVAMRRGGPFVEARLARHGDPGFDALQGSLTVLLGALGWRYDAY